MNATQAEAAGLPAVAPASGAAPRPYAASWLNRLVDWLEGLPGPAWVAYAALAVLAAAGGHVALWTGGLIPFGSFSPSQAFWGIYLPALLWAFGHLQRVAVSAFDAYRAAVTLRDAEAAEIRYRLSTVPAGPAWLALVIGVPLTGFYYLIDPVAAQVVGYTPVGFVLRLAAEGLVGGAVVLIVVQAIRQLRLVARLHAMPEQVDIFQPRPLYAFSRLTSRIGIVLVAAMATGAAVAPPATDNLSFWVIWAPWLFGPPILGVTIFVLPLLGMHNRLAREKERVRAESDARLKAVLAELNEATDARDVVRAEGLSKLASAQMTQRDLLARLHTWPWSAGTLGTLVPALALPVVVYVIQRLLAEVLAI